MVLTVTGGNSSGSTGVRILDEMLQPTLGVAQNELHSSLETKMFRVRACLTHESVGSSMAVSTVSYFVGIRNATTGIKKAARTAVG